VTRGAVVLNDELKDLLLKEPLEPFRVKLMNGEWHDVFYPENVAMLGGVLYLALPDQNCVLIPFRGIASVESLIADYPSHAAL
jgi:hypothetical protein